MVLEVDDLLPDGFEGVEAGRGFEDGALMQDSPVGALERNPAGGRIPGWIRRSGGLLSEGYC
jgi:hypothetical protein